MNTQTATKKITLATVKSFIKVNRKDLLINVKSSFDGMTDCVERVAGGFVPAKDDTEMPLENCLGIKGAWFVGQSRDYFSVYNEDSYTGIKVSNSCGSFILAVKA